MQPSFVPPVVVYAGDTWSQSYEFKAGDPAEPIDFIADGWDDWVCQCRPTVDSSEFFEINIDTSEAADGRIILSASAEETRDFYSGVFDLQSSNNGEVRTWIRSTLSWIEDVSR